MNNKISPKSILNYILLKEEYKLNDLEYIKEKEIKKEISKGNLYNIGIKKSFFKKIKKKFGKLKCQVCGNDDLIENGIGRGKQPDNLATIEHIIPISEGGFKYIETNYLCTCNKCNNKRGIKPLFPLGNDMYIY